MANRDAPNGFKAIRHAGGGEHNRLSRHHIASALASSIFRGDAVIPVNTSKNINVATAGARLLGVFDGVMYVDSRGEPQFSPYWATGTVLKTGSVADAFVYDDPQTLFECQADGAIVAADIGAFVDLITTHAGVARTGQSGMEVNSASVGTSDGQFLLVELLNRANNAYGTNAKVVVQINEHYRRGAMTGI